MKTIIDMAREAGLLPEKSNIAYQHPFFEQRIERFAELVRADEREACAKDCEGINSTEDYYGERPELCCAEVIRARGQA